MSDTLVNKVGDKTLDVVLVGCGMPKWVESVEFFCFKIDDGWIVSWSAFGSTNVEFSYLVGTNKWSGWTAWECILLCEYSYGMDGYMDEVLFTGIISRTTTRLKHPMDAIPWDAMNTTWDEICVCLSIYLSCFSLLFRCNILFSPLNKSNANDWTNEWMIHFLIISTSKLFNK